jgi:hypothetical protein
MRKLLMLVMGFMLVFYLSGCSGGGGGGSSSSLRSQNATITPTGEDAFKLAANDVEGVATTKGVAVDIVLTATGPEGSTLSYIIDTQPTHGTLTQKEGPIWTYTPEANFSGLDQFTYHVNDGQNDSNIATVSLEVLDSTVIIAQGGQGLFNDGGAGGALRISSWRHLSLFRSGTLDSGFNIPVLTENLGLHPAIITTNTEIAVLAAEPAYGVPYMVVGDNRLFISNANGVPAEDFEVASGLKVGQGVIVLVQSNFQDYAPQYGDKALAECYPENVQICSLAFTSDIVIDGTIKTKPIPSDNPYGSNSKGSLMLVTGRYFSLSPSGTINLTGDTGSPYPLQGGKGGKLWVHTQFATVLKGLLDTSGGKGTKAGGQAGFIQVTGELAPIYSLGTIKAIGGDGEGGGDGGNILIRNDGFDIYSSGTIATMGGASIRGDAGQGGRIKIVVGTEGNTGNLIISGPLNTTGGDSADRGAGGNGGDINLKALTGNMKLSGDLMANGGAAQGYQNNGGNGGNINIDVTSTATNGSTNRTGLIQVASMIQANGGEGMASGGMGGQIRIETLAGDDVAPSHNIELIGYQSIDLNGADGSQNGGCGGSVLLFTQEKINNGYGYFAGPILNEVDIFAKGGNGAGGTGGSGGSVTMQTSGSLSNGSTTLVNSGAIDISDGGGAYGVNETDAAQAVNLLGLDDVDNSGAITANGGDALMDLIGGTGGKVMFISNAGNATNAAEVSAAGGTGPQSGGMGGAFELKAEKLATNSANLLFNGGNALGAGGKVEMDSGDRPTVNTAALITVAGGTNGNNGLILIDMWDVTPIDGTLP